MDIATLQLEIDSRKAAQAKKELDELTTAAEKTEAATDSLSKANAEGEDRYKAIARAALERKASLEAENRAYRESSAVVRQSNDGWRERSQAFTQVASAEHQARLANERQAKAMADAAKAAEQNQSSLQKLMGQIDPLEGKLNRLDAMEQQLTKTFRQGSIDVESYGVALAKIHGQRAEISDSQVKQVAAGADEAATSMERLGINTASARYDMMMLGRAVTTGNWTQASSSMLQLGTRTNLAGAAARVALHPITLLIAGLGALYYFYEKGAQETRAYNDALINTGNIAGLTSSQIVEMADRIGGSSNTVGAAALTLVEIISTSKIAARDIEVVGGAITGMAQASGRSVSDLVGEFKLLSQDPVRGLEELNDKYHYLSLATYEQVRALVEQGRQQEAVSVAVRAHSDMLDDRAPQIAENIGIVARAWREAKNAASGYVIAAAGAISGMGAPRDSASIRADLDAALQERDRAAAGVGRGLDVPIKWIQENVFGKQGEQLVDPGALRHWEGVVRDFYQELNAAEARERKAAEQGRYQKIQDDAMIGSDFLAAAELQADKGLRKANEIAKTKRRAWEAITGALSIPANEISEKDRFALVAKLERQEAAALADIEKRYTDKGSSRGIDISAYKRNLTALNDAFKNSQQILESERRAGLTDEESYWARKLELIDENERAQKALMAGELARLSIQKASGKTKEGIAKQIADIEAQMAKASADADKERAVASNEQIATYAKMTASVNAYVDALRQQVEAARQAGQMQIAGMGVGGNQRELLTALSGADAKYAQDQKRLAEQFANAAGKMSDTEYQQKFAALTQEHNAMRDVLIRNYELMREAEMSWLAGASEGLNNYADTAANVYGSMASSVTGAFKSMEDSLTSFVTNGKLDFRSLADSIIQDMVRITIQQSITGPLAGALGGAMRMGVVNASSDPIGSMISLNGWADGGYTGPGSKFEPAGIVHRGEYVLTKEATSKIGVPALDRLNRGYSSGGLGGRTPGIPAMAGGGTQVAPNVAINLINKGGEPMQATQKGAPRFDGKKWVIDIVLEQMRRDRSFRREMQNAVAG